MRLALELDTDRFPRRIPHHRIPHHQRPAGSWLRPSAPAGLALRRGAAFHEAAVLGAAVLGAVVLGAASLGITAPAHAWEEPAEPECLSRPVGDVAIPTPSDLADGCMRQPTYTTDTYCFDDDVAVDPPLDITEGCPRWRWLAIQEDPWTPCPAPDPAPTGDNWTVELLFGGTVAELPWELKPFCLYETRSPNALARQQFTAGVANLVGDELTVAESSCGAVAPMQSVARRLDQVDPIWEVMEQYFDNHAQPLPPIWQKTPTGKQQLADWPRVRLAFLDSQPSGRLDGFAYSPHGLALMKLARRLVCQDGNPRLCSAQVVPELALPIVELDALDPKGTVIDHQGGGHIGTVDQIAQAVWRAVMAWENSKQHHLVLNLSVGWVGELFGGLGTDPEAWPVSVRSLHAALRVASCRDALIVASSGNNVGGPQTEVGALLPARWEELAAPTYSECHDLLATDHSDSGDSASRLDDKQHEKRSWTWRKARRAHDHVKEAPAPRREPLLYAAGGVHADGVTLVNARPGAEPARVAYADHALTHAARVDGWPSALTGSSVAAAVVSSAAAAVWHVRPELSRAEVMDLVEASGRGLGRQAVLTFDGRDAEVRQIGVCPAVRHALNANCEDGWDPWGKACPQVWCPEPAEVDFDPASDVTTSCAQISVGRQLTLPADLNQQSQGFCERPVQYVGSEPPENPCPFRQFWGVCARPWVCPQPDGDPCPTCPGGGGGPPSQGGGGFVRLDTSPFDTALGGGAPPGIGVPQLMTQTPTAQERTASLRIHIDPSWPGEIYSVTLGVGDARYPLDLSFDALGQGSPESRCVVVDGIPADQLESTPAAIYFHTSKGSWESPVFYPRVPR